MHKCVLRLISLTQKLDFLNASRNHRHEYFILISDLYLHAQALETKSLDRRTDRQESDSIRILFLPFEVKNPNK